MATKKPASIDQWEGFGGRKSISKLGSQLNLVYIAGPMRGIPDFNFPEFDRGRDYINGIAGSPYVAISPADMDRQRGFQETEVEEVGIEFYQNCMRRDIEVVSNCFGVLLLNNWEKSTGANNELFVARTCGVNVWIAQYDAEGDIIGHAVAPEWLRSPLIYGDIGHPEWKSTPLVNPTKNLSQDKLDSIESEVTQTLDYPPIDPFTDADRPPRAQAKIDAENVEPTVLEEANGLIFGPRNSDYGHPLDDFTRTGRMWGAILGVEDIPAERVGLCMSALKISRECNKHKRDNLVDLAGYGGTVAMCVEERERRDEEERQAIIQWLSQWTDDEAPEWVPTSHVRTWPGEDRKEVIVGDGAVKVVQVDNKVVGRTVRDNDHLILRGTPLETFASILDQSGTKLGEWPVVCGCGEKLFDSETHGCVNCGTDIEEARVLITEPV